jgi:hypothetical protein
MPMLGIAYGYQMHIIFIFHLQSFLDQWVLHEAQNQGLTRFWLDRKQGGDFRAVRATAIVAPRSFHTYGQTRHQITGMGPTEEPHRAKLTQPEGGQSPTFNQELAVNASGAGEGRVSRAAEPRKM